MQLRSRMTLALAGIAAISLVAAAPAMATPAAGHPSLKNTNQPAIKLPTQSHRGPGGITEDDSSNWTGYVDTPKTGGAATFKEITASYTVPSVNCAKTGSSVDAFAYHWVGLDGWNSNTVEQDGVADFCEDGTASYAAWHEMYPAGLVEAFTVSPGDAINSTVTFTSSTGEYVLSLKDVTSGQSFSVSAKCATAGTCENNSAEDITEGYTTSPWVGTADYGQEFYNNATVTDANGNSGDVDLTSRWNVLESVAIGATSGDPMSQAGQLYTGISTSKSALEISWERVN